MSWPRFAKYPAFAWAARQKVLHAPAEVYGRALFMGLILGIFTALWRAVSESGMPVSAEPARLVWYLAITEWIVLSAPLIHLEIEREVRRGDVAYRLSRPASYLGSLLFEALGELSVRLPTLGCAAFGWAWVFTREFPSEPASWLWAIPLAAFAAVVLTVIYLLIGVLAFWLGETAPVHWVCQKLLFVLGGLMLPLELYPRTLLTVAHLTPFPAMLYAPASLVLGTAGTSAGTVACWLGVWFALLVALAALLLRSAHRKLQLGGG